MLEVVDITMGGRSEIMKKQLVDDSMRGSAMLVCLPNRRNLVVSKFE
jgi:hypothetical protein